MLATAAAAALAAATAAAAAAATIDAVLYEAWILAIAGDWGEHGEEDGGVPGWCSL